MADNFLDGEGKGFAKHINGTLGVTPLRSISNKKLGGDLRPVGPHLSVVYVFLGQKKWLLIVWEIFHIFRNALSL